MDRALGGVPWWPMTKQEDEEKSFIKTCHYKQHVAFGASSSPMSSSSSKKNKTKQKMMITYLGGEFF